MRVPGLRALIGLACTQEIEEYIEDFEDDVASPKKEAGVPAKATAAPQAHESKGSGESFATDSAR